VQLALGQRRASAIPGRLHPPGHRLNAPPPPTPSGQPRRPTRQGDAPGCGPAPSARRRPVPRVRHVRRRPRAGAARRCPAGRPPDLPRRAAPDLRVCKSFAGALCRGPRSVACGRQSALKVVCISTCVPMGDADEHWSVCCSPRPGASRRSGADRQPTPVPIVCGAYHRHQPRGRRRRFI